MCTLKLDFKRCEATCPVSQVESGTTDFSHFLLSSFSHLGIPPTVPSIRSQFSLHVDVHAATPTDYWFRSVQASFITKFKAPFPFSEILQLLFYVCDFLGINVSHTQTRTKDASASKSVF